MPDKDSYQAAEDIAKLLKGSTHIDPLATYLKIFALAIKRELLMEMSELVKETTKEINTRGKQAGI